MSTVYKTTDRVKVKIDNLVFEISPLSYERKCEIQSLLIQGNADSLMAGTKLAVQYGVKSVKGLKNIDGSEYSIELEDNKLSDSCIDDLLNLDQNTKITSVCGALLEGIPKQIIDPSTGEPMKGVRIDAGGSHGKKK